MTYVPPRFGPVWPLDTETNRYRDSAGGGGKKSNRMDKIKEKNAKLNAKRTRRIEEEKKNKKETATEGAGEDGGMHPSRKARMK